MDPIHAWPNRRSYASDARANCGNLRLLESSAMSPVVAAVAPFAHADGGAAAMADVNSGTDPLDTHES